jgi:protein-histidine N-methyltransferase
MSPASAAYRDVFRKDSTELETDPDAHTLPPADPTTPSELPVNPSMVAAFLESLTAFNIHLHLIYGPWNTFNPGSGFDIVLTSETIYRQETLSLLLDVMWNASSRSISDKSLDELAESKLSLEDSEFPACYVAGKVFYFGVGGGISDFVNAAENPHPSTRRKGTVEIVKEHTEGVGRKVVRVRWT